MANVNTDTTVQFKVHKVTTEAAITKITAVTLDDEGTFIIALFKKNVDVFPGDIVLAEGVVASFQGIKQLNIYEKHLFLVQSHSEESPAKKQRTILG